MDKCNDDEFIVLLCFSVGHACGHNLIAGNVNKEKIIL